MYDKHGLAGAIGYANAVVNFDNKRKAAAQMQKAEKEKTESTDIPVDELVKQQPEEIQELIAVENEVEELTKSKLGSHE